MTHETLEEAIDRMNAWNAPVDAEDSADSPGLFEDVLKRLGGDESNVGDKVEASDVSRADVDSHNWLRRNLASIAQIAIGVSVVYGLVWYNRASVITQLEREFSAEMAQQQRLVSSQQRAALEDYSRVWSNLKFAGEVPEYVRLLEFQENKKINPEFSATIAVTTLNELLATKKLEEAQRLVDKHDALVRGSGNRYSQLLWTCYKESLYALEGTKPYASEVIDHVAAQIGDITAPNNADILFQICFHYQQARRQEDLIALCQKHSDALRPNKIERSSQIDVVDICCKALRDVGEIDEARAVFRNLDNAERRGVLRDSIEINLLFASLHSEKESADEAIDRMRANIAFTSRSNAPADKQNILSSKLQLCKFRGLSGVNKALIDDTQKLRSEIVGSQISDRMKKKQLTWRVDLLQISQQLETRRFEDAVVLYEAMLKDPYPSISRTAGLFTQSAIEIAKAELGRVDVASVKQLITELDNVTIEQSKDLRASLALVIAVEHGRKSEWQLATKYINQAREAKPTSRTLEALIAFNTILVSKLADGDPGIDVNAIAGRLSELSELDREKILRLSAPQLILPTFRGLNQFVS